MYHFITPPMTAILAALNSFHLNSFLPVVEGPPFLLSHSPFLTWSVGLFQGQLFAFGALSVLLSFLPVLLPPQQARESQGGE